MLPAARRRRHRSSEHTLFGLLGTLLTVMSLLVGCLAHGGEAEHDEWDDQQAEAERLDTPRLDEDLSHDTSGSAEPQVDSGLSSGSDESAMLEFSKLLRGRLEASDSSADAGSVPPVLEDEVVTESQIAVDSSLSIVRELLDAP